MKKLRKPVRKVNAIVLYGELSGIVDVDINIYKCES